MQPMTLSSQQAPVKSGPQTVVAQIVPTPCQMPAQVGSVAMAHSLVVARQQAPWKGVQGLGEQVVSVPCQMFGDWHCEAAPAVQVPFEKQQAPVGCGQGLGEQMPYSPCQMEGEAQEDWRTRLQAPLAGLQQAPGCAQGLGAQLAAPFQTCGEVQLLCRRMVTSQKNWLSSRLAVDQAAAAWQNAMGLSSIQ
jgi:hypothetical protein